MIVYQIYNTITIPYLVLALAVGFVIGRTYTSMVLALAIVWWPLYARHG